MAVSNRSLAVLAIVAVGLASWWAIHPAGGTPQYRGRSAAELVAVGALEDSATRLGMQVRTAAIRDRVDSAVQGYPAGQAPAVIVLGDAAPAAATLAESLFATLPDNPGTERPVRLVIVEGLAPLEWPRGTMRNFAILPESMQASGCTIVTLVFPRDSSLDEYSAKYWRENPFAGAAGPCWFFARFGFPGPQIRRWLDARYWDVAGGIPPFNRILVGADADLRDAGIFDRVFRDLATRTFRESATFAGCAGERPQLCEKGFLLTPYQPNLLPAGIVGVSHYGSVARRYSAPSPVGLPSAASDGLLAMMIDDLGPARFTEFWTSTAPVADAFEAAAGMTLGDWYRAQLRHQMQAAGLPAPHDATFWPSALGILVLALSGSLWLAGRRQVR